MLSLMLSPIFFITIFYISPNVLIYVIPDDRCCARFKPDVIPDVIPNVIADVIPDFIDVIPDLISNIFHCP